MSTTKDPQQKKAPVIQINQEVLQLSNESSGAPQNERKLTPLSCPGAPGQDRGVRVGTAECEFRAALFAYLPGKLTCPVAFALNEHGRTMVEQPIQRCRCCRRVTEDRSPFSWHFITGHNDAFLFVACRYQLKKQLPLQRCERNVPQLIEDEQFGLVNIPYFFIKCTCIVSFFHLFHQPGHGIETNRKASLQGKLSQRYAQVCVKRSLNGPTKRSLIGPTSLTPESVLTGTKERREKLLSSFRANGFHGVVKLPLGFKNH